MSDISFDDNFERRRFFRVLMTGVGILILSNAWANFATAQQERKAKAQPQAKSQPKPAAPYAEFEGRLVDLKAASQFFQKQRELQVVKLNSAASLDLLSKTLAQTSDQAVQEGLLRGIVRGLEGRRSVAKPAGWDAVTAKLQHSPSGGIRGMIQQLNQVFGDEGAANQSIAKLKDRNVPVDERQEMLRTLVTQQNPQVRKLLTELLDDPPMRIAAIRSFAAINDPDAPVLLLSRYSKWDASTKQAVVETLAMRKNYASALLAALKAGKLPKQDIPAHVARPLSSLLGGAFTEIFGDLDEMSKDKTELVTRYTELLTPENLAKADPAKGRLVFTASCSVCHKLYGEGGVLGPDLTGSNRADIAYILLNMIEPSADIPEGYQLVTLHTKNGQILAGTVTQEDDQRVVLNMVGQTATILKGDITKREVSPVSMMPEGLLPSLQDAQVLDLVKYLQTTQQVDLPK